jgi:acyl carrier protein
VGTAENPEIEQAIYECIWKVKPSLKSLPMTPATRLTSLGLASIDILCVVFEIEERFDVSIVDRQLDKFKTIGEGRDLVKRLQAAEDAPSAASPATE